jgi:hypothetical protein
MKSLKLNKKLNKSWNALVSMLRLHINIQSKEDVLITKLQNKLGKSKKEVKTIISAGLMDVLTKVPFSCK